MQEGGFRNKEYFLNQEQISDKFGNQRNLDNLYMDGASILVFTLDVVPRLVKNLLEKSKLSLEEIDHFIFHQANEFIIKKLISKINIPLKKVPINLKFTGNTVSSSVPMTYQKCIMQKHIISGQKIMLIGFGVGLSWAGCILRA